MELTRDLRICKLGKKSQRGYWFTEDQVRKFLDSTTWARRKADKTAFVSVTHRSRRKPNDPLDTKAVGPRDYMLVDKTTVGAIIDSWIEDEYWMCKILIFDPDKFEGKAKEEISYAHGLLASGVKLRSSAGVEAYYNEITKHADVIYDLAGCDFTNNPDFEEGGIV